MVQSLLEKEAPSSHTYWKLRTPDRSEARRLLDRYDVPFGTSDFRLQYLHKRLQRGLLIYEKCTNDELRKFCLARNLQLPSGRQEDDKGRRTDEGEPSLLATVALFAALALVGVPVPIIFGLLLGNILRRREGNRRKEGLIAVLERDDKEMKFEKFGELPAELRVLVYEEYVWDLPRFSVPGPPPLLKVPGLRSEALPSFYDNTTYQFPITVDPPNRAGLDHAGSKFLHRAPKHILDEIQRFRLYAFTLPDPGYAIPHRKVGCLLWIVEIQTPGHVKAWLATAEDDAASPWKRWMYVAAQDKELSWMGSIVDLEALREEIEERARQYVEQRTKGGKRFTLRRGDEFLLVSLFRDG